MTRQLVCSQEDIRVGRETGTRTLTAGFGSVMTQMSSEKGELFKKMYVYLV